MRPPRRGAEVHSLQVWRALAESVLTPEQPFALHQLLLSVVVSGRWDAKQQVRAVRLHRPSSADYSASLRTLELHPVARLQTCRCCIFDGDAKQLALYLPQGPMPPLWTPIAAEVKLTNLARFMDTLQVRAGYILGESTLHCFGRI